jgi:succinate dehydrogenase / fumarate reductase membrane anchor subunit
VTSYRTDISRARGLGSARHGSGHWLAERITSVALVPLGLWSIYSVLNLSRLDYDGAVEWLRSSAINPVLLVLTLAISFLHMHNGMRVIVEDYIEHKPSRLFWILLSAGASLLAASLSIFAVLKVALGAPLGAG